MKVAACHTCDGGPALVRARGSSSFDLGEIDERAQKACSMLHACAVHAPEPSCVVTTTTLAPAFQGNMLWMQPKLPAKLARIRAFHETCAELFFGILALTRFAITCGISGQCALAAAGPRHKARRGWQSMPSSCS